jgi:hypothetical protein
VDEGTYEVPVERGKIREFARAAQSENPAYQREDAVVPATFVSSLRNYWDPRSFALVRELGLDLTRVLHAEEEYRYHGPLPRAGDVLTARTRIGEIWEKEGKRAGRMRFATLVTEFRSPSGDLVAEIATTLVETSKPPEPA